MYDTENNKATNEIKKAKEMKHVTEEENPRSQWYVPSRPTSNGTQAGPATEA